MKKLSTIATMFIVIFIIFGSFMPTNSVHGWWYSDYASVKVPVKPTGIMAVDAINCTSASLSYSGKTYTASVQNPLLSNSCNFTFSNVYVKYSGWYTLQFKYRYYFSSYTKTISVYVSKPLFSGTYTTSTSSYKP